MLLQHSSTQFFGSIYENSTPQLGKTGKAGVMGALHIKCITASFKMKNLSSVAFPDFAARLEACSHKDMI